MPPARTPVPWLAILACFLAANAVNALAIAIWTPLAWGLRGSSYESGRPDAGDRAVMHIGYAILAIVVLVDVGWPLYLAVRKRWSLAAAFALAWFTIPAAYVLGLRLIPLVVRVIF